MIDSLGRNTLKKYPGKSLIYRRFKTSTALYFHKYCGANLQCPYSTLLRLLQPRFGLFEQSLKRYTAKASKSRSQSDHEITLSYKLKPSFKQTQKGEAI